jgi:Ankyrin repeats (3 copies)
MARKKAQRKQQETALVPHRTPDLSVLLERAKAGGSSQAVRAYLDAGGSFATPVQLQRPGQPLLVPLLHYMAITSAHPHRELAESVQLLVAAGADINAKSASEKDARTALMCAVGRTCCTAVPDAFLRAGADPCVRCSPTSNTALHVAARIGSAESCDMLLAAAADELLEATDDSGWTALMHAAAHGVLANVKVR